MKPTFLLSILAPLAGCAVAVGPDVEHFGSGDNGGVDGNRSLRLEPATLRANVIDHALVVQPFKAYMVDGDGVETDVTAQTEFVVADARFGGFDGANLYLRGDGAGATQVIAKSDKITGAAPLEVHTRTTSLGAGVPAEAASMFATAITGTNCGTKLSYPTSGALVPANLGTLDVHWSAQSSDVFEVRVSNEWAEHITYTRDARYAVDGIAWQVFATSRGHADIRVASMQLASRLTKCVAEKSTVRITDTAVNGAAYFAADGALVRHDLSTGGRAMAQPVFTGSNTLTQCVGCHAMSRDGARMAITVGNASGQGSVYDFAEDRAMPFPTTARWSSATFTPDGNKLLAVDAGTLKLYDVASGTELRTFTSNHVTGTPEISPDGTQVVTVEAATGDDWQFAQASVVVRTFSNDLESVGEARVLLPYDAASDMQSYYPSWSPDGKWIAVTRSTSGSSYANANSDVYVIAADGSRGPFAISSSREADAWAKWLPYETSVDGEQVFFLSFTSRRAFGSLLPAGTREQLWLAPFFPGRAIESPLPVTAPAFRAPWQDLSTDNHNVQWAASVVTNPGTIY